MSKTREGTLRWLAEQGGSSTGSSEGVKVCPLGNGDYLTINDAWDAGERNIILLAGTHGLTGTVDMHDWIESTKTRGIFKIVGEESKHVKLNMNDFAFHGAFGKEVPPCNMSVITGTRNLTFDAGPIDPAVLVSPTDEKGHVHTDLTSENGYVIDFGKYSIFNDTIRIESINADSIVLEQPWVTGDRSGVPQSWAEIRVALGELHIENINIENSTGSTPPFDICGAAIMKVKVINVSLTGTNDIITIDSAMPDVYYDRYVALDVGDFIPGCGTVVNSALKNCSLTAYGRYIKFVGCTFSDLGTGSGYCPVVLEACHVLKDPPPASIGGDFITNHGVLDKDGNRILHVIV